MSQKVSKWVPKRRPKSFKNHQKIVPEPPGAPTGDLSPPGGYPPPKGPKIHRFLHEFRSTFWQSTATHRASKTKKKNGGRSVLYLLLWGERLRRQSTGYSLSLQNSKKKWRALPPVFLALGGASPQAECWLRNDAMPDASQNKKRRALSCTPGLVYKAWSDKSSIR